MPAFDRHFDVARAEAHAEYNAWFCDLLSLWAPAGYVARRDASPKANEQPCLRLAVRAGYFNMYRLGQSVARVANGRMGLRAEIHHKYIGTPLASMSPYLLMTRQGVEGADGTIDAYAGIPALTGWINNAESHSHEEKRFVDGIVSRNPNIVDLEMGLPAYLKEPGQNRAPRMDLVALEPNGKAGWRIVFWEAKMAGDGRARSRGAEDPKVVGQLNAYTAWLKHEGHVDLVAQAYRDACRLMVRLHDLAKAYNSHIGSLGEGVRALAAENSDLPEVDIEPRLLIDGRCPEIGSFIKKDHLEKLKGRGIYVQVVKDDDDMVLGTRP